MRLAGWVARSFGRGPRSLDGWHAALEGARGFGVLACSSGAGGSHSLDGRHAAQELGVYIEFGWVSWGPAQSLDGWHAALEQGARGFDACAGHF